MADKKYHQFPGGTPTTGQILLIANPTTGALTKITMQQLIDFVGTGGGAVVAPSIISQPTGQTITQGQTLNLSISAQGTAPLSYQWKRGGVNLPGQTSSSLVMPNAQPVDTGSYTCTVSNSAGSVTSNAVNVTVNAGSVSYSTTLTFVSSTQDNENGVNGTVSASNATIKFQFNGIIGTSGLPSTMNIYVSGIIKMVIDFPSDYSNQAFLFTDTTGTQYNGNFTLGDVNF